MRFLWLTIALLAGFTVQASTNSPSSLMPPAATNAPVKPVFTTNILEWPVNTNIIAGNVVEAGNSPFQLTQKAHLYGQTNRATVISKSGYTFFRVTTMGTNGEKMCEQTTCTDTNHIFNSFDKQGNCLFYFNSTNWQLFYSGNYGTNWSFVAQYTNYTPYFGMASNAFPSGVFFKGMAFASTNL